MPYPYPRKLLTGTHRGQYGEPCRSRCEVCGKNVLATQDRGPGKVCLLMNMLYATLLVAIVILERC